MLRARALILTLLALLVIAPAAHAQDAAGDPGWDDPITIDDGSALPLPAVTGPTGPAGPALPTQPVQPTEPEIPQVELVQTAQVPGTQAKLRTDGRAAIPRGAPKRIRVLIAAMNRIVGKPYKWGGGHAKLIDSGYDCSGSVSYGLIGAGLLSSPMVSGTLAHWGASGAGKYLTIYANKGHVYLEVAGLRLDTSPVADAYGGHNGVRWRSLIGKRRGFAVRHVVGL